MKVYHIQGVKSDKRPLYSLTIDPGVATSGLCLLDNRSKEVKLHTIKDPVYTNVPFPELYVLCNGMVWLYKEALQKLVGEQVDYERLVVNCEYTFYQGTFSQGLMTVIALIINEFLTQGIQGITLIPPQVPQYFLRTTKKLRDAQIKAWVKSYTPMFEDQCDSPHVIDALMMSIFMHYPFYQKHFKIDCREPDFEIIRIGD